MIVAEHAAADAQLAVTARPVRNRINPVIPRAPRLPSEFLAEAERRRRDTVRIRRGRQQPFSAVALAVALGLVASTAVGAVVADCSGPPDTAASMLAR